MGVESDINRRMAVLIGKMVDDTITSAERAEMDDLLRKRVALMMRGILMRNKSR